jgi:hypothetical protein
MTEFSHLVKLNGVIYSEKVDCISFTKPGATIAKTSNTSETVITAAANTWRSFLAKIARSCLY